MAFESVITQIGLDKAVSASINGIQIEITHIGFGTGGYTPLRTRQTLNNEVLRVPVAGSKDIDVNQVHLTALVDSGDFTCREIGFYLADGTLFSVMSHPTNTIFYKTAMSNPIQGFDLVLDAVPIGSVTVTAAGDLTMYYATEFAQMATAQMGTMRRQVSQHLDLLNREEALAQRLSELDNHITRLDNRRDYLKQQLEAQVNRLERIQPNYRLSKNQRLLGAATPDFWSLHPDMTLSKVLTVADDVLWANRSAEEQALLTAMGKPDTRYIHQPFEIWRMSWTTIPAMPSSPFTMYQRVNQAIETTVAAMVKLESGEIAGSWASGAKLNTWVNTGEHRGASSLGYTSIHPMRASTAGSLLVALPAAVAGYVPLGEGRWGDFPYIGDTQNA